MLYLVHTHWLWFFGALVLGIVVGWLTYLCAATRWTDRPVQIAIGVVTAGAIMAIAEVVPGRYGYWLELGVIFAVTYTVGCFIGWALRDLAESMPAAARPGSTASAAPTGSYLFRDAFGGMGADTAYVRSPGTGIARDRVILGAGALAQAPVPGGYTFPRTAPFAGVPANPRAEPVTGLRRHWSWPKQHGDDVITSIVPEFTGSKNGYVFPAIAGNAAFAGASRVGTTRAGLYKHWTWRGTEALAATAPAEGSAPADETASNSTAVGLCDRPIVSEPAGAIPAEVIVSPAEAPGAVGIEKSVPLAETSGMPSSPSIMTPQGPEAVGAASALPSPPSDLGLRASAATSGKATRPMDTIGDPSVGGASGQGASAAAKDSAGASAESEVSADAEAFGSAIPAEVGLRDTPLAESGGGTLAATPLALPRADRAAPPHGTADGVAMDQGASMSGPSSTDAPPSSSRSVPAEMMTDIIGGAQTTERRPVNDGGELSAAPGMFDAADTTAVRAMTGSPAPASGPIDGSGASSFFASVSDADDLAAMPAGAITTAGLPTTPPSAPGQPATIAAVPGEEKHGGERPEGLVTARDNRADNLKRIRGIGPRNEGRLHGLGIWHFDQIAAWTPRNVSWVGSYLAFPGRIDREAWVEQAKVLAGGGDTDYSRRAPTGGSSPATIGGESEAIVPARPRKPPR